MAKVLTHAAVARFKPDPKRRREIPDAGARGLHLVIEPSGVKSFGYRFRRPGTGVSANLRLGRFDTSGREHDGELRIGDPLSLAGARALVAELERQRLRGRDPAMEHQAQKKAARIVHAEKEANLFPACVRAFVDEYRIPKKGRKPRGWRKTAAHLGLRYPVDGGEPEMTPHGLAERWAQRPVTEIGGNDIHAVVDEARRRGIPGLAVQTAGVSDARGRKVRDSLGGLFRWLLEHRRIAADPCAGVWRPPPPAPRERVLSSSEIKWFWRACDKVGAPYEQGLKLLMLTGCRLNEIAQAKWDELPDDYSELRLPPERTKNGRPHNVPMAPLAQGILRYVPKFEGSLFVFTTTGASPAGGWNRAKRRIDERMLELVREERGPDATIPAWVTHDLRRTCASGMQKIGIRAEVIERCLNHTSGIYRGVAGVYQTDPLTDDVRVALERWARHVEGIVSDKPAKVIDLDTRRA